MSASTVISPIASKKSTGISTPNDCNSLIELASTDALSPYSHHTPVHQNEDSTFSTPLSYSLYQNMDTSYDQQEVDREYAVLNARSKPRISIFNSSYLSTENLLQLVNGEFQRRSRIRKHSWIFLVLLLILVVLLLLLLSSPITTLSPYNPFNSDKYYYPLYYLPDGAKIQLNSVSLGGKFLRVDPTSASSQQLILTEKTPWRHGSTFEVFQYDESCFQLRSMRNMWLRVDYDTGEVVADGMIKLQGTFFSAVLSSSPLLASNGNVTVETGVAGANTVIRLKVCKRNVWVDVRQQPSVLNEPDSNQFVGSIDKSDVFRLGIAAFSEAEMEAAGARDDATEVTHRRAMATTSAIFLGYLRQSRKQYVENSRTTSLGSGLQSTTLFRVSQQIPIRGVNLGGWFIPEVWMLPGFFEGSKLGWSGSLCRMVSWNRSVTEDRMAQQLKSWMTEADFSEIAARGFNSVRLPVGYWNIIHDPYRAFAPANLSLSLQYIDWAFDMAEKYGLSVLLDLHGAPGSQNGIDHSGCSLPPSWTSLYNIDLSLETVEAMSRRYGMRPGLLGFELLNEPARSTSEVNHSLLLNFYERSYHIIRKHSREDCMVVFNELYERYFTWWRTAMREPEYYNVVMDWHLYNWQAPYTDESRNRHITDAVAWSGLIDMYSVQHPIMIGEWSMSTGTSMQVGQEFVDACALAFRRANAGWYLWNWKIQRGEEGRAELGLQVRFDQWDVQLQMSQADGLNPLRFPDTV